MEKGNNPYICHFQDLICNYKFPVLKKKTICLMNLEMLNGVMDHIRKNTDYHTQLIGANASRLCRNGYMNPIAPFEPDRLKEFYDMHERIFIYGHGIYGKGISRYFEYKGWKFEGFVVSRIEPEEDRMRVSAYDDMKFQEDDGVILALGEKAFHEVYQTVKDDLSAGQLYCPQYGIEMRES